MYVYPMKFYSYKYLNASNPLTLLSSYIPKVIFCLVDRCMVGRRSMLCVELHWENEQNDSEFFTFAEFVGVVYLTFIV